MIDLHGIIVLAFKFLDNCVYSTGKTSNHTLYVQNPFPISITGCGNVNLHFITSTGWFISIAYRSQVSVFYSGLVLHTHLRNNMPGRKCFPAPSVGENQHGHSLEQNGANK